MIIVGADGAEHTAGAFTEWGGHSSSWGSGAVPLVAGSEDMWARHWTSYSDVYRANPWLFACGQLLARTSGRLPRKVYQKSSDGQKERVDPGFKGRPQRLAMALSHPGHGVSENALWFGTMLDEVVHGNALWEIIDSGDAVVGFRRIPWRNVTVEDYQGEFAYVERGSNTRTAVDNYQVRVHLPEDVIHFGLWRDPDFVAARSPIDSLHATLALHDAVYRHLVSFFARSARPSGVWQVDKATTPEAAQGIAEGIKETMSGPDAAGKVLVTSAEFMALTEDPANSEVVDLAKQSREEICGAYGIPPILVGISSGGGVNIGDLREYNTRDVVGPRVEMDDADLEAQLWEKRPMLQGLSIEAEFGAALRSSVESQAATWPQQLRVQTPNELRRYLNMPPLEDDRADELWFPNSNQDQTSGKDPGESEIPENEQPEDETEPAAARQLPAVEELELPLS